MITLESWRNTPYFLQLLGGVEGLKAASDDSRARALRRNLIRTYWKKVGRVRFV